MQLENREKVCGLPRTLNSTAEFSCFVARGDLGCIPAGHGAMVHGTACVRVGSNGGGYVLDDAHLEAGPPESHSGVLA